MKLKFTILLLISLFHLKGLQVMAQKDITALPRQWTLQACLDYAQKNNIQLQTLRRNIDLSEQDLLQARAARLPDLSAAIGQSFTHSKNATANSQSHANISGNYSLNSSLVLYQGGYIKNEIQARQLDTRQGELNVQQAFNDISLQITQAYLAILLDKENVITVQNLLQTSQAQYEQGKILFNAGSIAKNELVQLEASKATDQYNLVVAQNQVRQNTVVLKQILQLPSSMDFVTDEPQVSISPQLPAALEDASKIALQTRPEIKNAELAIQQAAIQLRQAYTATRPAIIAGASLSSGYAGNHSVHYFNQVDNNFYQNLGITLSLPIFSKRINKTNIEKSRILIEQSKLSLLNTKTVLSQQVEQAYINVLNAQSQYAAAQVQLKAAEESYRLAVEELKTGAVNMVSFLVQKNVYIQAQQSTIQAKYTVILNQHIYEFYMGKPLSL